MTATDNDVIQSIKAKLESIGLSSWAEGEEGRADRDMIRSPSRWKDYLTSLEELGVDLSEERALLTTRFGNISRPEPTQRSNGYKRPKYNKAEAAPLRAKAMQLIRNACAGGEGAYDPEHPNRMMETLMTMGWRWIKIKGSTNGYKDALTKLRKAGEPLPLGVEALLAEAEELLAESHRRNK